MSLCSSTFLGLEDGKQFRGVVVQLEHEFGLKIYSGNSMELSVDLKKNTKQKHKAQFTDFGLNKLSKVHLHKTVQIFKFSPVTCQTRQATFL